MPSPITALATDPTHASVDWGGETLHLLPERALWWPAQGTLFVADLHIGKAATYRALGQPVPHGTTEDNLSRLSELINRLQAQQLVCLGDFLHAAAAHTAHVLASLQAWRERHASLRIALVRGNHDDRAGDPPPALAIAVVDEPWLLGPFACCHHPQTHPTHHVLAGHLHPVVALQGPGRDRLRLPCFLNEPGLSILPAFGAFTGGHLSEAAPGRQHHAVGGDRVWSLPNR
ncbi:MAG: ligase-associated DNA damage response endonuclease PdeM [Hydrogenophaga sp.]|nr:ligase-associated DNA damage response endonuclease PdeM [Hydrogenophaga sp.]